MLYESLCVLNTLRCLGLFSSFAIWNTYQQYYYWPTRQGTTPCICMCICICICICIYIYIQTINTSCDLSLYVPRCHDDVIKWKYFPRYWPFVQGIHRRPHKDQWRGALLFPLICASMNDWVNNREDGDLRSHGVHFDVTLMSEHVSCLLRNIIYIDIVRCSL